MGLLLCAGVPGVRLSQNDLRVASATRASVLAHHGACYALRLTELLDSVPAALEANAVSVVNVVVVDNDPAALGETWGVG